MIRTVRCSIIDMPDGCFAVVATLGRGKIFRRTGLRTLDEAAEAVEMLRAIMVRVCEARMA